VPITPVEVFLANPGVRVIQWPNAYYAYFTVAVYNLSDHEPARAVRPKWRILNSTKAAPPPAEITDPDAWSKYIGQPPPFPPTDLPPRQGIEYRYSAEIGGNPEGRLELHLVVSYTDPRTGQPREIAYRGFVEYSVPNRGDSKGYLFSPLI